MVEGSDGPQGAEVAPRDSAVLEIREMFQQPGCPVCALALRAVGRFIQTISYEQVNDPSLREELRAAGGFCHTHAYHWLREARNVLGTAIIYRDVLSASQSQLQDARGGGGPDGGVLSALLGPRPKGRRRRKGTCPACRAQRQAEDRYLGALLQSLADPAVAAEFERSSGLCCEHTREAGRKGGPGSARIVERTRQALAELIGELSEVIRKEDYRFRSEPRTQGETTAPRRAVAWVVGAEGLTRTADSERR